MMDERDLAGRLWTELGGAPAALERIAFTGAPGGLPSRFEVSALAAASIAVATLAVAEFFSHRSPSGAGKPRKVLIDRRLASAAFRCEHYMQPQGWKLGALWDPIAGDYEASDGWIRLHTNYPYHRAAALRVLQCEVDRKQVAAEVKRWKKDELEAAVVAQNGCAAALRTREDWKLHPQGKALALEPLVSREGKSSGWKERARGDAPLSGVRVLDLTRVIAGPVGTRHLAAFGADVLRIDPPRFEEVPVLLVETTRGKRCAFVDLKSGEGRAVFQQLLSEADVLVHGYRPGAMEGIGFPEEAIADLNPGLVTVRYDAYGWSGPWASRRGFDSLVQMSSGIAHPGTSGKPTPLPAQALDYATGYLVAAAVCRALVERTARTRLALARTAKLLVDLGEGGDPGAPALGDASDLLEVSETGFGPVKQVRCPAAIEGFQVRWPQPAGPLGRHPAHW
jgi:hypothetical protein